MFYKFSRSITFPTWQRKAQRDTLPENPTLSTVPALSWNDLHFVSGERTCAEPAQPDEVLLGYSMTMTYLLLNWQQHSDQTLRQKQTTRTHTLHELLQVLYEISWLWMRINKLLFSSKGHMAWLIHFLQLSQFRADSLPHCSRVHYQIQSFAFFFASFISSIVIHSDSGLTDHISMHIKHKALLPAAELIQSQVTWIRTTRMF